jgi:flagellar protein FlbD
MIQVTQLNGTKYWVNPHQIETITCNPDVTLSMLSGKFIVVKEKPDEIIERIIEYRKRIGGFSNEL